jgi:hypothetical protein
MEYIALVYTVMVGYIAWEIFQAPMIEGQK